MLNGLMLLGLLGLSVPIIIHLIQRQRLKPQPLATLRFLEAEDVANAFAPVPRDLLQLLLRLLLLAAFMLLMARFTGSCAGPAPRTLAVILDASLSMRQVAAPGQPSVFTQQREAIETLIGGLHEKDRLALFVVGDEVLQSTGFLNDQAALLAVLDEAKPTAGGARALMPTLHALLHQLHARHDPGASVIVYSDLQQQTFDAALADLARAEAGDAAQTRALLAEGRVRLFLVHQEAPPDRRQVALLDGRLSPAQVYLGAGGRLTSTVRNDSAADETIALSLFEGESAGQQRQITLPPGGSAQVDLVHRFESPVDTVVRVELADDSQPGDNQLLIPARLRERRQILLVGPPRAEGENDTELSFSALDLLAYAINPGEALGGGAGTNLTLKRVTPPAMERLSLPVYHAIILHGVTDLPTQTLSDLGAYLKNGGGLWLIPERETSPLRFHEAFGPLLGGGQLGQLKVLQEAVGVSRDQAALANDWLAPLLREEWGDLRDLQFSELFAFGDHGTAQPLLRADNGDWLYAGVRQGRGMVVLQLFPGDLQASSLPRASAFVPVVQELLRALAQARTPVQVDTLRAGELRRVSVPEFRGLAGLVQVKGPTTLELPLQGPEQDEILVRGLHQAGAYELSHPLRKTGRKRWLTVNPDPAESALTTLSPEDQSLLFGETLTKRVAPGELAGQLSAPGELLPWLLALVALAFVAEALAGFWQARRKPQAAEAKP